MKRFVLILATAVTVLFTGVVLVGTGWLSRRDAPPRPAVTADETRDALNGPASWHFRHSQPTHWRACVLQQR
jgi:hypothetical protein